MMEHFSVAENMNEGQQINERTPQLPQELIDWLTKPITRFLRIEAAAGSVLLLFTIAALVLSNSSWDHPFLEAWETPVGIQVGSLEFSRSLREWINDALMTLFFFLVALELKRELVLGELRNPRMAALPIVAALGGMLVPAVFYLILQSGQPGVYRGCLGWYARACRLLLDTTVRSTRPEWLGHSDGNRYRVCHRLSGAVGVAHSPESAHIYAVVGDC
jgi:hypothetical protein